jgi:sulfur relay protein TusB/DsrH
MEVTYLFGFSEITGNYLDRLLPILKAQIKKNYEIGFVLIHDGVIGFSKKGNLPKSIDDLLNLNISIYALKPDLNARGIAPDQFHDAIKIIDYEELVDLFEESKKIISWL